MTSLYENFHKDLLPKEYGGNQILDTNAWKNLLLSQENMFKGKMAQHANVRKKKTQV